MNIHTTVMTKKAKPFVKWVGGKTQLLSEIEAVLSSDFSQKEDVVYVEPFVGGGAVLFWILQKYPNITKAVINDINPDLITTYKMIKNNPEMLLHELERIQNQYLPLSEYERKEYYIAKRNKFNQKNLCDIEIASLFIFLNRTCFNGLYRVNSKGLFNVPHGRYTTPKICDEQTILADSKLLQKVDILCGDFAETIKYATPDTFFYFDPPYKPLSETSSFNSYSKEGFDDMEQIQLKRFYNRLQNANAFFMLSNSDCLGKDDNDCFFNDLFIDYDINVNKDKAA